MMIVRTSAVAVILGCAALPAAARAQATPEAVARVYVAAARARDVDARIHLLHPAVRRCMADAPWFRAFVTEFVSRQFADTARFNAPYTTTLIAARGRAVFALPESLFALPVTPTHLLNITTEHGFSSATSMLQLVKSGDTWFDVLPCPTRGGAQAWIDAHGRRDRPHGREIDAGEAGAPVRFGAFPARALDRTRRADHIS